VFRDSAIKDAQQQCDSFSPELREQQQRLHPGVRSPAQFRNVLVSNVSVDGAAAFIRVDGFDPPPRLRIPKTTRPVYQESDPAFMNVGAEGGPVRRASTT